jgi:cobalt-zinc-cadmium efflux system outer membrane protein
MWATAEAVVRRVALTGSLVAAIAGCATVDPAARFAVVRDTVDERLDRDLAWQRDAQSSTAARRAASRLLAEGLTADEAVQVALLGNRRLQAQLEGLGIAQADLVEAGLLENPVLSLTVYSGDPGSIVEGAIVQDLVSLLSLSVRKSIAGVEADRVSAEVAQAALQLAAEVKTQYYSVMGGAQMLELVQQVAVSTQAAAELAGRQQQAGNLSRREQAIRQAFHAQAVLEAAQAQLRLAADREKLNRLLGLSGEDTGWTLPGRLPGVPDALPPLEQVEATAMSQRLDLLAAEKEAEAAAQALDLTRRFRYLSTLGIGVAYKREPDGEKFYGPEIELGVPLFDRGQGRVARAEAEYRRSTHRAEALAVEIRSEAREARERLTAAHRSVRHLETAMLPLQQSIVDETLKFYNGMLVGVYDLLLAQQGQVQAGRDYVAALESFWQAWAELERALGGRVPLPPGQPAEPAEPAAVPTPDAIDHEH